MHDQICDHQYDPHRYHPPGDPHIYQIFFFTQLKIPVIEVKGERKSDCCECYQRPYMPDVQLCYTLLESLFIYI